jgi:hypothetical protein
MDMEAGTMTSSTPARRRAATVRRRRRVARMRIGGVNEESVVCKYVGSDVCEDGFEAILGVRRRAGNRAC